MQLGDLAHLLVQKHSPLLQAIAEEMESNLKVAQMGSHAGMWVEFAQVEHSIKPPGCNHCFLEPACNSGVCRPSQPQGLDAGDVLTGGRPFCTFSACRGENLHEFDTPWCTSWLRQLVCLCAYAAAAAACSEGILGDNNVVINLLVV